MRALTTFSIVGRSARTGQLGVAVSTADVGAGRLVTWARAGVGAVATQSWPSLYLAIDALRLMQEGSSATDALAKLLADDPGRSVRQVGIVDRHGGSATFSGDECTTWYGGINGPDFAAQGNMLIRGDTVSAMAASFLATADLDLSERLVQALEAGPGRRRRQAWPPVRGAPGRRQGGVPAVGYPGRRKPKPGARAAPHLRDRQD